MTTFLLKTEPGDYSYDDLVKEKRCAWTGVKNPAAQSNMRTMKKGDEALIYHTGDEKAIVGLAKVVSDPYPDPDNPGELTSGEPKFVLIDLAPAKKAKTPVTLKAIKADERFAEFALVKQSRLSAMPVPKDLDKHLRKMAGL